VGFEQPKAKPYKIKATEKTIAVPLRDFGDTREVRDHTQDHFLRVWIELDGRPTDAVVAITQATPHWVGRGRKKTAVAEAVLRHGSAKIEVNGHPIDEYFKDAPSKAKHFLYRLLELDRVHDILSQMEVFITVTGSDPTTTRQAKAVAHALARALISYDPNLRPLLKQAGFGGVRVEKQSKYNRRKYR
jgi:small subunit ribosomal protein S9